jgi:glyoxylase-like metal-dependent hydrolase (beta-lactamase superfamily II)
MDRPDDSAASLPDDDRIHRLEVTVDWPPGHAAAYLLEGSEPVLIDAGAPGERGRRELRAELAVHDYTFEDISHLLLTHPHSDHLGGAKTVIDAADPVVYAPVGVRSRLDRAPEALVRGVRETARGAGLRGTAVEEAIEEALDSLRRNRRLLPPDAIDIDLTGGEGSEVGDLSFQAIHTPGHQVDHACFHIPERGVLFSGDVLIEPFRAAALDVGFDRGADDAFSHYYAAYDRLAGRAVDRVYPGHGPVFGTYEVTIERSRRDLDERVGRVLDRVTANVSVSPLEVARAQLPDDPHPKRLRTTLLETLGALGSLEEDGRVSWKRDEADVRRYRAIDD